LGTQVTIGEIALNQPVRGGTMAENFILASSSGSLQLCAFFAFSPFRLCALFLSFPLASIAFFLILNF
jgi:hypothetical protein